MIVAAGGRGGAVTGDADVTARRTNLSTVVEYSHTVLLLVPLPAVPSIVILAAPMDMIFAALDIDTP